MFKRMLPLACSIGIVAAAVVGIAGAANAEPSIEQTPTAVDSVVQSSPLDPYIDILYRRLSEGEYAKQFFASEQIIATCMTGDGLVYTPRGQQYLDAEKAAVQPQTDSRQWVALNGYGINASTVDEWAAFEDADPNLAYVNNLSATEQDAYYLSLRGDQNNGGSDTGCAGLTGDTPPLSLSERWAPLVSSLQQLWTVTIPSNPDWVSADRAWSECMAVAGHTGLKSPASAQISVGGANQPFPGSDGHPGALVREIDVALADLDCRTATSYDSKKRAVTVAAESTFFEQNRQQLDVLLTEHKLGD